MGSLLVTLTLTGTVQAQVASQYTYSQFAGSFTPLTAARTVVDLQTAATGNAGLALDNVVYDLSGQIPFTFPFNGTDYTGAFVSTKGFLTFGTTPPAATLTTPLNNATAFDGAISAFSGDLIGGISFSAKKNSGTPTLTLVSSLADLAIGQAITGTGIPPGTTILGFPSGTSITMSANATNNTTTICTVYTGSAAGEISFETFGVTPNQEFVVQWINFRRNSTNAAQVQDMRVNFQIRLAESGDIQVVYGNCSVGAVTTDFAPQVGLRGLTNADYNNRLVTTSETWATSIPGITNNSRCRYRSTAPATFPATGQVYQWLNQPACFPPTFTSSFEPCVGSGMYTVTVTVTGYGDGGTADISNNVDGVVQASAVLDQAYVLGPYPFGTARTFKVLHGANTICDQTVGTFGANTSIPNDNYWTATTVDCATGTYTNQALDGALDDPIYTDCGAGPVVLSGVWYKYVGSDERVTISTCGSVDPHAVGMTVYSGTCGAFTCVGGSENDWGCNPGGGPATVVFNAYLGTDYYVFVSRQTAFPPPFTLTVSCTSLCTPPPNAACNAAVGLTVNPAGSCASPTPGNTSCSSAVYPTPTGWLGDYVSTWYSFTAGPTGSQELIVTLGTAGWTGYAIYGSCGGAQVLGTGNFLFRVTSGETYVFTGLTPGATYYLLVGSLQTTEGTFSICLREPAPPPCVAAPIAPADGGAVCGASTTLSWPASAGATGYHVYLDAGAGPATTELPGSPLAGTSLLVNGLTNGLTAWTVAPYNAAGTAAGCSTWTFTVSIPVPYYADMDGDGFGAGPSTGTDCTPPNTGDVTNNADDCPTVANGNPGDTCDDANATTVFDVLGASPACGCAGTACTQSVTIEMGTDGGGVRWALHSSLNNAVGQSSPGFPGYYYPSASPNYTETTCLPNGEFYFVFEDEDCDGVAGGGYIVRVAGKRVIDNRTNLDPVACPSQISGYTGVNNPVGNDRLISQSCDRMELRRGVNGNCSDRLTADNTPNGSSGNVYQFWIYDANGGLSFIYPNAVSGTSNQVSMANLPALVEGTMYNVRVRTRMSPGVWRAWGNACRMRIDNALGQCGSAALVDDLSNANHSCGITVTLPVGNQGNGGNNMVVCMPVVRYNNNCVNVQANKYQWRFRIPAENVVIVLNSPNNLKYLTTGVGFESCKTYTVEVRASFDAGATWCRGGVDPYNDLTPWGTICEVYTGGCLTSGNPHMAAESSTGSGRTNLNMYPNPNRGDQLFLSLNAIEEGVHTVSVDIHDAFGKRISARTIAVADGFINTVLELNGELTTGLYMVNITAGDAVYSKRLVIQP